MPMPQTRVSRSRPAWPDVPTPLPHELARPELVAALDRRWSLPVTCVIAGAGFGKTTLLAQALRADAAAPRGIDGWITCDSRHDAAAELAAAITAAVHAPAPRASAPIASVVDALRRHAPIDVCLVLDDVHVLGDDSSGARLLAELVVRLPANAHLVLAGQRLPPVPLARLRAADRVLELIEHDLCFTTSEIERLAARLDRPAHAARSFGGWPALVRVALAARPGAAHGFVREEVLADLDDSARRDLLALAVVGTADNHLVEQITGCTAELDALVERVPLVSRFGDERFRAHDLWGDALRRVLDAGLVAAVEQRAIDALVARGDLHRAGEVAIRAREWTALGRVALELVRTTISVLPLDTASRWLAAVPPAAASGIPELRLLAAARRAADDFQDRAVDAELDAVADVFRERRDADAEVTALAVATVAAQSRGDTDRLVALAMRTADVPGATANPIVRLASCSIAAVVAEMSGDPETAIEHFRAGPLDDVPAALAVSGSRFLMHCLLLAGRAAEAVAVADRWLSAGGSAHSRTMPAFARWLDGDPSGFLDPPDAGDDSGSAGVSDRDAFLARAFHAVIRASWGEVVSVPAWCPANARDAAVVTNAHAARAVVTGDEPGAAAAFEDFLARHGDDRLGERHLRRFLTLGYVLAPTLRERWDRAALGPAHERARAVARLFLDVRAGRAPRDATALEPAHLFTVLPLPWSIELACRLHALRSPHGVALSEWLLEHAGCRAHTALRHAARADDDRLAAGAAALLARVPRAPSRPLSIGVLGPLVVHHGDDELTGGDLRRQRVRELLAMLVVEQTLTRDRAIDALWPDHDLAAGARNLRVTLTYLRRVLEPDRPAGEASFHLRADAATIRLVPSAHLRVDLWDLQRLAREAGAARAGGEIEQAIQLLTEVTRLWRGTPLTDLDRVAGFEGESERVRLLQTQSLLDLGELQLTVGDTAGALAAAERALTLEPYLEAAHRLAIAACVHRGDHTRLLAVTQRARRALDELGVTPEPATAMLLRTATGVRSSVALAS